MFKNRRIWWWRWWYSLSGRYNWKCFSTVEMQVGLVRIVVIGVFQKAYTLLQSFLWELVAFKA